MFVRQFNIDKGRIDLLGEEYILFDALALFEIQKIDQTKLYEVMKNSSFRNISESVKYAKVYSNVKDVFFDNIAKLGDKIGKTDEGILMTLKHLFDVYGLGELEIADIDNSKKRAVLRLRKSTIGEEYVKRYKKSDTVVDIIAAGVLAGIFAYVFGKKVDCVEKKCIAKGDSCCEFEVA